MAFDSDTLGPAHSRARNALKDDTARRTLDAYIVTAGMFQAVADTIAGDLQWKLMKKTRRHYGDTEYELSTTANVRTLSREEAPVPLLLHVTPHPHADSADQYWQGTIYFGIKKLDFFAPSMNVPYHALRHMRLPNVQLYEPIDLD